MNVLLQTIKALFRKAENNISAVSAKLTRDINSVRNSANVAISKADIAQTTAVDAQAAVRDKMDAHDPVASGSFSMGRSPNTSIGENSHAEGVSTTASGKASHAEGETTTASGKASHAEGETTTASSSASHAEGSSTKSSGIASHAEGSLTRSSGSASHAEGSSTKSIGIASHAEGNSTESSGIASHAEGWFTNASSDKQHVQGSYNVVDEDGRYAHIVGNGSGISDRSNAHTLDWNGVPWFMGRPQFGGNAQDDNAQTVIANGDKEIILTSFTEGSSKQFRITVDDSGTITAVEVAQ